MAVDPNRNPESPGISDYILHEVWMASREWMTEQDGEEKCIDVLGANVISANNYLVCLQRHCQLQKVSFGHGLLEPSEFGRLYDHVTRSDTQEPWVLCQCVINHRDFEVYFNVDGDSFGDLMISIEFFASRMFPDEMAENDNEYMFGLLVDLAIDLGRVGGCSFVVATSGSPPFDVPDPSTWEGTVVLWDGIAS